MDNDNLATPSQKQLMMELGLKNKVGLTKSEAMRQIDNAITHGLIPKSWETEPATEKQKNHISEMSGLVWREISKADAKRYISELQEYHDGSSKYKCGSCESLCSWKQTNCEHCNSVLSKNREIIKPRFKPKSLSWFKERFYIDRTALVAIIILLLLALPGIIIRMIEA